MRPARADLARCPIRHPPRQHQLRIDMPSQGRRAGKRSASRRQIVASFKLVASGVGLRCVRILPLGRAHRGTHLTRPAFKARSARADSTGDNVGVDCVETQVRAWPSINEPLCVETQHVKAPRQRQIIQDCYRAPARSSAMAARACQGSPVVKPLMLRSAAAHRTNRSCRYSVESRFSAASTRD